MTEAGDTAQFTRLLTRAEAGDPDSATALLPLVYEELRALAHDYFRREPSQTIQPTDLVHEAYLRLVRQDGASFANRRHFFAIAATMMRRVLVDRARQRGRQRRGADRRRVALETAPDVPDAGEQTGEALDLIALDEALDELAQRDGRKARIVELRYFAGLGVADVAGLLDVSEKTVKREWAVAKGWLYRRLADDSRGR